MKNKKRFLPPFPVKRVSSFPLIKQMCGDDNGPCGKELNDVKVTHTNPTNPPRSPSLVSLFSSMNELHYFYVILYNLYNILYNKYFSPFFQIPLCLSLSHLFESLRIERNMTFAAKYRTRQDSTRFHSRKLQQNSLENTKTRGGRKGQNYWVADIRN